MLTKKIQDILKREVDVVPGLAGPGEASTVQDTLRRTHSAALRMFYGSATMTVALFVLMTVLLVRNSGNPAAFTAISAASGVSFGGLIFAMIRISREVTQSGLLISVADRLPPQDLRDVFLALLEERGKVGNASGGK